MGKLRDVVKLTHEATMAFRPEPRKSSWVGFHQRGYQDSGEREQLLRAASAGIFVDGFGTGIAG